MVIAGVVILTVPNQTMNVFNEVNAIKGVTTYGVFKGNHIIAVFEGEDSRVLDRLSKTISETIPGVLGIFPAYVNFEEQTEAQVNVIAE